MACAVTDRTSTQLSFFKDLNLSESSPGQFKSSLSYKKEIFLHHNSKKTKAKMCECYTQYKRYLRHKLQQLKTWWNSRYQEAANSTLKWSASIIACGIIFSLQYPSFSPAPDLKMLSKFIVDTSVLQYISFIFPLFLSPSFKFKLIVTHLNI